MLLSYLGQAALIRAHPSTISNPFYLLVPSGARIPMVVLATAATIIASQAAITGSFSVAKQAVQLGFLPRLKIVHTSKLEGQIYVPLINWGLCIGVGGAGAVVPALSQAGRHLRRRGHRHLHPQHDPVPRRRALAVAHGEWKLALIGALFLTVEVAFFSSNLAKIAHGAWLPSGSGWCSRP